MRPARTYTYLGTTTGMCRQCRKLVPARLLAEVGVVYQESICPTCGSSRARIADDLDWYVRQMSYAVHCKTPHVKGTPVQNGCPKDCGPCEFHANACRLPVFSVTNACNLNCPICFTYNRPDQRYHMSREELRVLLDRLIERAGPFDLINITGGEPTLHPHILDLLKECQRPEIGRVTMNSNGLRLARDRDFCQALAELGVYVVLSFDTFNPDTSQRIHGCDVISQKMAALENLQHYSIGTTLLNVMIRGLNDGEIGRVIDLARTFSVVRSVTVQTMTFTGHGGKNFQPREHTPLDGATHAIEAATKGVMKAGHFFPHAGAHPLCYSVAYFLKDQGQYFSLTDFFKVEELRAMLGTGYLLQPDEKSQELFQIATNRLWTEGSNPALLAAMRRLINRMYPPGNNLSKPQRQRIAEDSMLTVYVHAHMDEDNLDLARLTACPDQVPDPEGRLIPACAYNLFYRQRDSRFWMEQEQ